MSVSPSTRDRLISTAAHLFQERGVSGTGVLEILRDAHAPRGSLYHHFPDGKPELVLAALERSAQVPLDWLTNALALDTRPADAVERYVTAIADVLEATGFRAGCPLATAVLELAATDESVAALTDAAFNSWRSAIADALDGPGAAALAALVVSAIEGALILARAAHDTTVLRDVGHTLAAVLAASGTLAPGTAPTPTDEPSAEPRRPDLPAH